MDYIELLRAILEDTKQTALAEELGTAQANISRWLKGQEPRGPMIDKIRLAAQRRGIIPSSGHIYGFEGEQSAHLSAGMPALERKFIAGNDMGAPQATGDVANFTIHAGMGHGGTVSVTVDDDGRVINPEDSDGFWSFPTQVKAGWPSMKQTYAMPVTGDSMEPTLPNGAHVFIDTSHNIASPPDLYALDYGHGLMIKRIELLPPEDGEESKIHVISDNERYQNFTFNAQDVEIYGRVIASFHWRG